MDTNRTRIINLVSTLRSHGHKLQAKGAPGTAELLFDAAMTIDTLCDRIDELDPLAAGMPVRKPRRMGRRR